MKLNQTEQFIVWGITGNLTDAKLEDTLEGSINAFKNAGILTEKGERLFNEVLEYERENAMSIMTLLSNDMAPTRAYKLYDVIDDNFLGADEDVELSIHEVALVVLLTAQLNHTKTLQELGETIENTSSAPYKTDVLALYDDVRDNEFSTHRSLYLNLDTVLEEMGYIDRNQ